MRLFQIHMQLLLFRLVTKSCPIFATPWTTAHQVLQSFTISQSLPKFMSSDAIQPLHPLSPSSPSVFPSIRVFSSESALRIRWPKYWSFSFSIHPSSKYSGLISFRMEWFGLLAVQGSLKRLLQHNSLKVSILWCSAFFMVQLSHLYMTTGKKTVALTIWTFVGKVMALLFNMLSRFVIAFLPRKIFFTALPCMFHECMYPGPSPPSPRITAS